MNTFSKPDLLDPGMGPLLDRERLAQCADALAVAVAVSLPWSTSATGILIGLWLVVLLPTLDLAILRREVIAPAGGLPVLLWLFGAVGMLWAGVSWGERLGGLSGYHKLLLIPLLLAQFRRSAQAQWVLVGFAFSCAVLLGVSWALALIPGLTWRGNTHVGVPVKDYILQSELFAVCAFGLLGLAAAQWRRRQGWVLISVLLAMLFITNVLYVETARTTLVVMAVLLLLFGFFEFGWRGALLACLCAALLACAVWVSSPYLRERVLRTVADVTASDSGNVVNSAGLRLGYWRESLALIAQAPLAGNGTGSIAQLFRRDATAQTDPQALTGNPHNQVLVVGLQLGLLGTAVLLAMWMAHVRLFAREMEGSRAANSVCSPPHCGEAIGVGVAGGDWANSATTVSTPLPNPPPEEERESTEYAGRPPGRPDRENVQSHDALLAWLGIVIVAQNIVASMFNSHLFDFSQGWLYVWGVGVLGGSMRRRSAAMRQ